MGVLEQEIEDLTKQIAEAEKVESEPAKAEEVEVVEAAEEEKADDATDESQDKAEEKVEEKPAEAEKTEELDASGYARLRREAAANKKRADELEARLAAVVAPVIQQPVQAPAIAAEPDKAKDPVAWFTWRDQQREQEIKELKTWKETVSQQTAEVQLETAAAREFQTIEAEFKASVPDFDAVADNFNNKLAQSVAMLEPHLTPDQVMAKVKDRVLRMAGEYVRQGLNPVEELYHLSKERYGYKAPVDDGEEEPAPKKPDLAKVAANRKRNAGTAGAKGSGSMPQLTREVAADMPVHEWAALSADEKRRLLNAG